MVLKTPLAASHAVDAVRGSCIDNVEFAKTLQRTLREMWDRVERKLSRNDATAGGVATDASKPIFFLTSDGPTAAS